MNNQNSIHPQLLGLVELDQAGTVLYARLERDPARVRSDISGLNFFSDVALFKNVEEFRRRIEEFRSGQTQVNSFNFTCDFDEGRIPVRVLVARIRERSNGDCTKSILVHIRPA
jgi:hypothetical protein